MPQPITHLLDRMERPLLVKHQDSLLGLGNLQGQGSLQLLGSRLGLVGRHLLPLEESR